MRSSSIFIKYKPSFQEIKTAIETGFLYLNMQLPIITNRLYGNSSNYFPYIEGKNENEWTWICIMEWFENEENDCKFLCDIQSRGNNLFAAIVCYSLCKSFGEKIEDDAGYLKAGCKFTFNEFEIILKNQL